jgi:hypothetical protein
LSIEDCHSACSSTLVHPPFEGCHTDERLRLADLQVVLAGDFNSPANRGIEQDADRFAASPCHLLGNHYAVTSCGSITFRKQSRKSRALGDSGRPMLHRRPTDRTREGSGKGITSTKRDLASSLEIDAGMVAMASLCAS